MEFFRKGFDPPPLLFGSYGTRAAHLIFWGQKGKNKTSQKHPKWSYLRKNSIGDIASLRIILSLKTVQLSPPIFGKFCEKLIYCFFSLNT